MAISLGYTPFSDIPIFFHPFSTCSLPALHYTLQESQMQAMMQVHRQICKVMTFAVITNYSFAFAHSSISLIFSFWRCSFCRRALWHACRIPRTLSTIPGPNCGINWQNTSTTCRIQPSENINLADFCESHLEMKQDSRHAFSTTYAMTFACNIMIHYVTSRNGASSTFWEIGGASWCYSATARVATLSFSQIA